MTNHTAGVEFNIESWTAATSMSAEEVAAAWQDLERRGLVVQADGQITVSPLAQRRATSDAQRRLASHLSGYLLTENSFIVRRAGQVPGSPQILNARIAVEQIANYFKDGWASWKSSAICLSLQEKKLRPRFSII